jgi:hypothetical protein
VNELRRKEAVMKTLALLVAVVALIASGCSHEHSGIPVPSGPSPVPAPAPPQPPPPGSRFSKIYSEVTVGQVVHGAPTPSDPECVDVPGFTCQHFRVTPSTDGTLTVVITFSHDPLRQVLDLSLMTAEGWTSWANHDELAVQVMRGQTYEITVWYLTPGVTFELRTMLN